MSHQSTTWAYEQHGIGAGPKFLLVTIANYANKYGIGFPGREALAEDCEWHSKTVTDNMKFLESEGLIARVDRRRENGSKTSNWIVLAPNSSNRAPLVDAPEEEFPENIVELATSRVLGNSTSPNDKVDGQVTLNGGPEQIEEPSEEQQETETKKIDASSVDAVWVHYAKIMANPRRKPTPKQRRLIASAVQEVGVDGCRAAIDACAASPWHMGANPQSTKYNEIDRVLKTKLDFFLANASSQNGNSGSALSEGRMATLKEAVLHYCQTGGEQERAEKARTMLLESGRFSAINMLPGEERAEFIP